MALAAPCTRLTARAYRSVPRAALSLAASRSPFRGGCLHQAQQMRARRSVLTLAVRAGAYMSKPKGKEGTFEWRVFLEEKEASDVSKAHHHLPLLKQIGKQVSPWHDIPLKADGGLLNAIIEIPKESSPKLEVATDEPNNPIKQDTKKGKLRNYPYNINWNYGMFPQTWEDPAVSNAELGGVAGDNDPVDVVEIGSKTLATGGVYPVKPLAILAMIDDGELDWKVIAISVDDPKASSVNDVEDVEREFPGEIEKIRTWFQDYKIPDGKPKNVFGYDNKPQNKAFTMNIIEETHEAYNKLKQGTRGNSEELALA